MTRIIKVDPQNPDRKILEEVGRLVRKGKIVVYPTETAYGFGTNALDRKAVNRIYKIKREPHKSNIITIVPDLTTAKRYGVVNKNARKLNDYDKIRLLELGVMRIWGLKERLLYKNSTG